jgi:hypothetical protein
MRLIRDEDLTRLETVKKRLHAIRLVEADLENFCRMTEVVADIDAVLMNIAELGKENPLAGG